MKILFNRKPITGPWGGGTKVLSAIADECRDRNYEIFFEEEINHCADLDIIFCMDPRPIQQINFSQLINKKASLKNCKLVQRIGDLGTHGKPELFNLQTEAAKFSDILIFPSEWAKQKMSPSKNKVCHVIPNAPLQQFIIKKEKKKFDNKLKIVSHHWSNNPMKGFDLYKKLDEYCKETGFAEFTFIGRKPDNITLTNHIPPQDVNELIKELSKCDVYITASKQEAGANHVLEALALSLPVLYHQDGGSINEYCNEFGFSYENFEDLIQTLKLKKKALENLSNSMLLKRSSKDMAKEYVDLFEDIIYESQY
jgi:glycosyltransferase involved in cell wall biosynthesis